MDREMTFMHNDGINGDYVCHNTREFIRGAKFA